MKKVVLDNCPHCGSNKTELEKLIFSRYRVRCKNCDATGGTCFTEKEAVDIWNKRVSD